MRTILRTYKHPLTKKTIAVTKCDCGEIRDVEMYRFKKGQQQRCHRCNNREGVETLKPGMVFGKRRVITVIFANVRGTTEEIAVTQCQCGTRQNVRASELRGGRQLNCLNCSI